MQSILNVNLSNLLRAAPAGLVADLAGKIEDFPVTGLALDSRKVSKGNVFVALKGENLDGHSFIPDAVQRGAKAVIGTARIQALDVPYIQVTDARQALAYFSAAFYGFPASQMVVIGVTGTDGKTTTSNLVYRILAEAGLRTGMITTVNAMVGNKMVDTGFHVTTPEAPEIQRLLAWMAYQLDEPVSHVVLETTSHGLAQERVTGCEYDIGILTNVTHEHLDYHKSLEAYRQAKFRLFSNLAVTKPKKNGNIRLAVLNRDDEAYDFFSRRIETLTPHVRQVSYGFHPDADIRAENLFIESGIQFFRIYTSEGKGVIDVKSKLLGSYNVSNCLAAFGAAVTGLDIDVDVTRRGIEALDSIPGRMERIDLGQNFNAIVDFAHTPNALKRALELARKLTSGKILAIFGSAGLRDRDKRRMMAEISTQLADITILTAEDPRTEAIEDILEDMVTGIKNETSVEGKTYWRVADRREAIRFGVHLAQEGDVVIALGKGHEQSMCFGETEYPWDDRIAMRAALAERLGIPGPAMPDLPD
jgi:UDP-N-acetylmuramoyl-L-alanyl-D-glutamate--2,6-diaminopimelate ligase